MSTVDLDAIRADLEYASSGIDGADMPYHPHALRAMRAAEKLFAEVERLRGTVDRVRALHHEEIVRSDCYSRDCCAGPHEVVICAGCGHHVSDGDCPTLLALAGEDTC